MVMIPPVLAGGTVLQLPGVLVPRVVRLEHQLFPGQKVMGAGKLMIFLCSGRRTLRKPERL